MIPAHPSVRAIRRSAIRAEAMPELPDPAAMTAEELRAEVEGGREAYHHLVGELRELRQTNVQLERNARYWRDAYSRKGTL